MALQQQSDPVAPTPLSYYVRELQKGALPRIRKAMLATWVNNGGRFWEFDDRFWRGDDQIFIALPYARYNGSGPWGAKFLWNGWEPNAVWDYDDESVLSDTEQAFEGHSWLIDLTESDAPLHLSETETLTIENTRSVEITHGLQVDVGVEATETIGGEFAGAKFEASLKESLNISDSEETKKAESESKTDTREKSVEYECEPRKITLVEFKTRRINSTQPFNVDGAPTWGVKYYLDSVTDGTNDGRKLVDDGHNSNIDKHDNDSWWLGLSPHASYTYYTITFNSLDEFVQAYEGHNTDFPEFGQINWDGKADDLAWLYAVANRHVQISGVQSRTYDNEPTIQITDLTNSKLSHDEIVSQYKIAGDHIVHPTKGIAPDVYMAGKAPDPLLDRVAQRVAYLSTGIAARVDGLEPPDIARDAASLLGTLIAEGE